MASSSFMNKQTVISGVTFATNNFVAILNHQDLPNEFHIIQDFLASSPLKFALTEPASVSFKSVMQVWNSATFDKGHSDTILMSFEYNGITHYVTPTIVEEALHLPVLGDAIPTNVSDSTLFEFVTKLGYNGEVKRYGNLFRTKLKKEWNFFFDTISRCFLNKTSNFDALPSGSLKIGYSLIHSTVFDYGSFILKDLSDRKSDKLGSVCFLRFLQLIFNHLCPNVVFENDIVLPICRITENNIKSLVNSDKANGFIGNLVIPDEVRFFLHRKMPTRYGLISNAMGQGQSHLVPNPRIHPKQSKQSTATSIVSQKTLVVKAKKSARTDVSGRQSGVLVKKAAKGGEVVSVKRKLVLRDETDSEDDLSISSIMNVNKEVADTATAAVVPLSTPQKKRKLSKSRYHIPLEKKQDTDVQDTSILNEQSVSTAQTNPDVSIPDAAPSQVVNISDPPAQDSPTKKHVDISLEKYGAAASNLGIKHPMEKLRKAEELVYQRQKKLKGSSPQEPEPQSGSAALSDDPATQEPLNQSLSEGLASGMVPQEPFSQRENEDINILAKQEPSSQSGDAGQATVSKKCPDTAQGISGADEVQRLVKDIVNEGSTQEPLTQSVEAASEPQAPQEPLVANTDARENEDINIPATQEPSSQSGDAGQATVSKKFPDTAQRISGADEVQRLVEDIVNEGSTQEPLTQSVEASSEPQAPQEPLVANTDASISNPDDVHPDDVHPDASGAPDTEPILIQPLRSRPMDHPISVSQDKMKGIAIPDPDVTHSTDDDDSDDSDDDENRKEKEQLATALKISLGTNFGSSSTYMAGKASTGKDQRQDFSIPSFKPAEALRQNEWNNSWHRSAESVSYSSALEHAYDAVKSIENQDLKNHLKATTLLSKSLKSEIDSIKNSTELVRNDISQNFTKVPTTFQLRVVEYQVKSVISEQTSINRRIDSLDTKVTDIQASLSLILNLLSNPYVKKGEKVSRTKCTPDLVLRNNDDDTGDDGSDKVIQGETSDAAVMKSIIQTSQSQTTQSTRVSDSGVKTVRTLVQSQILTEEQILTSGHGHTLATIPEGDEDIFIDNPEDASNLFQKFSTKDGRIVTLYHTDKRVQQLFARKALSTASEEYPDLSHEEFLRQQREMMESFNNPVPARGRGSRGRRGARRSRRGSSTQTIPRQTRSRGLRIEEIPEPIQTLVVPNRSTFGDDGNIEEEPELRRKSTLYNTNQIEESNPDVVPDNIQDPDDSEILQEIDLIILSTVVDSHNKEVDEEEEARRREITRKTNRDFNLYMQRLKLSNKRKWRNPSRQESLLKRSYAFEKEKDKKWKHISTLRCDTLINFQSGGIITSASSVVDLSEMVRSKTLWLKMFSNLKQLSSNSRGGIGHRDAEYLNMSYVDPYSLTEIGGTLTSENLNNLLAVDIVIDCHDGFDKKEKLLYFMKDGSVKILSIQDLLMKTTQELKYVHYLFRSKNQMCKEWSDMILSTIRRRLDGNSNFNGNYTPMYLNQRGQDVEMQRGTAVKEVTFGMTQLTLNPDGKEITYLLLEEHSLQRSSILNLRAAIYQINEEDKELRNLKERLIQILEEKEENLLSNFLKMNLFYQRI
ncbi:hypothetical protein POM88_054379 [Heracleum sosnowskyi]|uniref:Uncharacterized protein n=1 Tax=Heracleum sosnowskyi TaxID=360622 RepID=A0AAD8LW93_9APIA|nr:hypothetical protein POM88_054379 [Heracleum sosnowskyi]